MQEMYVCKRSGEYEEIAFDKILNRVKSIGSENNIKINYSALVMKVIDQLYDRIPTSKIDELTAEQCASMATTHPDYGLLAGHIVVSNHQKNTHASFYDTMATLYNHTDIHGEPASLLSDDYWDFVSKNKDHFESMIDHQRDYLIDFFGFKTLERAYLMRCNNKVVERPQHMWMRVAVCIHGNNMEKVKMTYDLMSQKYFTHATPTLFNAGTRRPQLSSCYLLAMENDSIDGIYNTLKECAQISKWAGGIGLHIHNVRARGTHIRGTNGTSNGIVPMLRVFNNTARYVDQCIHPETYIYTTKGPMKMQDITLGETEIFNKGGKEETVKDVLEHAYSGEIHRIKIMHTIDDLLITPEHPVYVLPDQKKGLNYNIIRNRLEKSLIDFEWRDVKDLTPNDMVVFPIPNYEQDIVETSADDCYMYGIILGDGYMNNNALYGHITLHSINKRHVINFCENYFTKKCVQFHTTVENNTTRIRWNKNICLPFRYSDIYSRENNEKKIHSRWINLPLQKAKYIIKGLLHTDGCLKNEFVFDSTSRELIEGLRYLLLRMGVLSSGYVRDRIGESHMTVKGIIENKKIGYCLRIPKTEDICELIGINEKAEFFKFLRYKNYIMSRIQSITTEKYIGTLYDLQMTNEHNYAVHNGLIHNGGGKRNGSFAIYLETWHADILDFLEMKKNHGDEEMKGRDLFYALWVSDYFMEKVQSGGTWCLFCPHKCPGLADVYGDAFVKLYNKYEEQGLQNTTMPARDLWFKILDAQMETGTPYILYKDAANRKSNQQNLGTIKSSNLCCEILEYSDTKETAVCNLASIALSMFVKEDKTFDYEQLHAVTKVVTDNLNKVIDVNYYPNEKTIRSNLLHRPIGIGIQGLADAFILMNIPYDSEAAREVNKLIFETIYHASLERSNEIACERLEDMKMLQKHYRDSIFTPNTEEDECRNFHFCFENFDMCAEVRDCEYGLAKTTPITSELELPSKKAGCYSSFLGSPASQGILQFDMWGVKPTDRYDWRGLKGKIMENGLRNSLLVAPMPTASTSQILGNNECFEPLTSNIYARRTLAGDFIVANKYLIKDLIDIGVWNDTIKNQILVNRGSIQDIKEIPQTLKDKYKIVWEIPMKHLINMAKDRGAFVCQSQSLNLWIEDPNYANLTAMHFYAYKAGLKTGIYYLRRKPKHQPQQFTIEPTKNPADEEKEGGSGGEGEICEMCSS